MLYPYRAACLTHGQILPPGAKHGRKKKSSKQRTRNVRIYLENGKNGEGVRVGYYNTCKDLKSKSLKLIDSSPPIGEGTHE